MIRLSLALLFFGSILFFPWWVSVFLGVLLLFAGEGYEVLFGGVLLDVLYGAPLPFFFHFPALYTALFSLLFLFVRVVKPRMCLQGHLHT